MKTCIQHKSHIKHKPKIGNFTRITKRPKLNKSEQYEIYKHGKQLSTNICIINYIIKSTLSSCATDGFCCYFPDLLISYCMNEINQQMPLLEF